MADEITPPEHLVELWAAFDAAQARAKQISEEEPEGEVLPTPARTASPNNPTGPDDEPREKRLFSAEQDARLNAARATARELAKQLSADPWLRAQPDRHAAEKKLHQVAADRRSASA